MSENEGLLDYRLLFKILQLKCISFFINQLCLHLHITNQLLQREETLIHALQPQLISLLKKVLGKFIKPQILAQSIRSSQLFTFDYKDVSNQVIDKELVVGYITRQKANKLFEDGDISELKYKLFFRAAREYLIRATVYMLAWFPLQDELLCNATWIDFDHRLEKHFSSVEFFVHKYPLLFPEMDMDRLYEQFLNYQVLNEDDYQGLHKKKLD